jgi:hypothetical protein
VERRAFPDWSMNYHRVDDDDGSSTMVLRNDESMDALLNPSMPRDLLYIFSKFLRVR